MKVGEVKVGERVKGDELLKLRMSKSTREAPGEIQSPLVSRLRRP